MTRDADPEVLNLVDGLRAGIRENGWRSAGAGVSRLVSRGWPIRRNVAAWPVSDWFLRRGLLVPQIVTDVTSREQLVLDQTMGAAWEMRSSPPSELACSRPRRTGPKSAARA